MEKILPLEEQSISQIYRDSTEKNIYVIPIYQRNYAWEDDQISALIKDVYDSMRKPAKTPYYIGTLVTYNRGDNKYEVIDGQQRLTTIYIILKVLEIPNIKNELTYSARKVSASTIKNMPNFVDEVDDGIRNGHAYAKKAIDEIVSETEKNAFKKYFLDNVHIIHYNVPKDVDLNHYFEVMNSRGEQLEKHEIVKSMLSQYLNDKQEMATFSRIWEACSEMNIYIQQVFNDTTVFGKHLEDFDKASFEEIPKQKVSEGKNTIMNLLKDASGRIEEVSPLEQKDKFQPIIDFPNFLLIVLKITRMQYDGFDPTEFALDDNELLNEFYRATNDFNSTQKAEFSRLFAFNLLKARYNLDNYIVHHSLDNRELAGENPWKLQYYYYDKKNKGYLESLAIPGIQEELVHLLSMFEVSFTPKQRKNYLFYCLMYLSENLEPSADDYLEFLQSLAHKYFYDVYLNPESLNERNQPRPNAFDIALLSDGELSIDEIGIDDIDYKNVFENTYKQGRADIPLFVFNYTDYMLWKKYADELRGKKTKRVTSKRIEFFEDLGCSDFGLEAFDKFYFSRTRRSLEHYYPQAKAGEDKYLSADDINCFGNFAMIGAEANSSGSNWDPKTKLDHYCDSKSDPVSVASLKFKIMMQKCFDNIKNSDRKSGMEWNVEDIKEHQEKMLNIVVH